jgi:segregation and condensation protein B
MENLQAIVEAIIFSADQPLSLAKMEEILPEWSREEISATIASLEEGYGRPDRGFSLVEVAGGWQLRTKEGAAPWVRRIRSTRPVGLSAAAMETLAIVAYRQPIVKNDMERLRGVDVSAPLKTLLEKKLVKILGRKEIPGRPIIYGTTRRFLEVFGLKDISELPTLRELKDLEG